MYIIIWATNPKYKIVFICNCIFIVMSLLWFQIFNKYKNNVSKFIYNDFVMKFAHLIYLAVK